MPPSKDAVAETAPANATATPAEASATGADARSGLDHRAHRQHVLQRRSAHRDAGSIQDAAAHALTEPATALPHRDAIQRSFGAHDVSGIQAHVGPTATEGVGAMGAEGFAIGASVGFAGAPSLHTAAHEAAHVVQQRAGISLKTGVGEDGDEHERHADQVADRVVRGESAEDLLDARVSASGSLAIAAGVQLRRIKSDGGYKPYQHLTEDKLDAYFRADRLDKEDLLNIEALQNDRPLQYPISPAAVDDFGVSYGSDDKDDADFESVGLLGVTSSHREAESALTAIDNHKDDEFDSGIRRGGKLDDSKESDDDADPPVVAKKKGALHWISKRFKEAGTAVKALFSNNEKYEQLEDYGQAKMAKAGNEGHRANHAIALDQYMDRMPDAAARAQWDNYVTEALGALDLYRHAIAVMGELTDGTASDDGTEEHKHGPDGDDGPGPLSGKTGGAARMVNSTLGIASGVPSSVDKGVSKVTGEGADGDTVGVDALGGGLNLAGDVFGLSGAYDRHNKASAIVHGSSDMAERARGREEQGKAKLQGASIGANAVSHGASMVDTVSDVPVIGDVASVVGMGSAMIKAEQILAERRELREIVPGLMLELNVLAQYLEASRTNGTPVATITRQIQSCLAVQALLDRAIEGLGKNDMAAAAHAIKTSSNAAKVVLVGLMAAASVGSGGVAVGIVGGIGAATSGGMWVKNKLDQRSARKAENRAHMGLTRVIEDGRQDDPEGTLGDANRAAVDIFQHDPLVLADGIIYLLSQHDDTLVVPLSWLGINVGVLHEAIEAGDTAVIARFRVDLINSITSLAGGKK